MFRTRGPEALTPPWRTGWADLAVPVTMIRAISAWTRAALATSYGDVGCVGAAGFPAGAAAGVPLGCIGSTRIAPGASPFCCWWSSPAFGVVRIAYFQIVEPNLVLNYYTLLMCNCGRLMAIKGYWAQ